MNFDNAQFLDVGNKREMGYKLKTTQNIYITDLNRVVSILNTTYGYDVSLYVENNVSSGLTFNTMVGYKAVMLLTFLEIPEKKIRTYAKFIPNHIDDFICNSEETIYTMFVSYRGAPEFTKDEIHNIENAFKEIGVYKL